MTTKRTGKSSGKKSQSNQINDGRNSNSDANVEQSTCHEPLAKNEGVPCHSRVHITFTHYRKRLCDPDGISVKAAIDGVVKAGLLKDDSSEFIEEIRQKQVKSSEEKTVIEIEVI